MVAEIEDKAKEREKYRSISWKSGQERKTNQRNPINYLDSMVHFFKTITTCLSRPDCAKVLLTAAPLVPMLFLLQCENIIEIWLPLHKDCTCCHLCCLIAKCSQNVNGQVRCVGEPIL